MDPVIRNILECAWAEFAKTGLEGTRIESIVEKTNTSKRMLYYHFGNKAALYEKVLEYAYLTVRPTGSMEAIALMDPLEALAAYADSAFELFHKYPDFVRLSLHENLNGAVVLKKLVPVLEANKRGMTLLEDILQRGQAGGLMRRDVRPLDVYLNFVGLCYYDVSVSNNYKAVFGVDLMALENQVARRKSIRDSVLRYVKI